MKGNEDIVNLLVEKGADLNIQVSPGFTAFILAAAAGNEKIVALLVDKGADVNIKSSGGNTALFFAVTFGHKTWFVDLPHLS